MGLLPAIGVGCDAVCFFEGPVKDAGIFETDVRGNAPDGIVCVQKKGCRPVEPPFPEIGHRRFSEGTVKVAEQGAGGHSAEPGQFRQVQRTGKVPFEILRQRSGVKARHDRFGLFRPDIAKPGEDGQQHPEFETVADPEVDDLIGAAQFQQQVFERQERFLREFRAREKVGILFRFPEKELLIGNTGDKRTNIS